MHIILDSSQKLIGAKRQGNLAFSSVSIIVISASAKLSTPPFRDLVRLNGRLRRIWNPSRRAVCSRVEGSGELLVCMCRKSNPNPGSPITDCETTSLTISLRLRSSDLSIADDLIVDDASRGTVLLARFRPADLDRRIMRRSRKVSEPQGELLKSEWSKGNRILALGFDEDVNETSF